MTALIRDPANFVETQVEDEIVVMALGTGNFFALSGTARETWELIDGTRDRDALVADLATRYSLSPEIIGPDVDAFISELRVLGFLRID